MATSKDWVPKKNALFFNFQDILVAAAVLNALAWNIPGAAILALQALQTPYVTAWNKIKNKKTRSGSDVEAHDLAREAYEAAIREFAKTYLMFNDVITNQQRSDMGVPNENKERAARPKITTSPFAEVNAEDGSVMHIKCRVEADSTRSSRHPDADGMEIIYEVGKTPPASIKECINVVVSKKATIRISIDPDQAGNKMFFYVRWVNLSDDSKSGPLSKLYQSVISD